MKITTETQSLMVIKDRRLFVFVVGAVFAVAGFIVIFIPDFFINKPPLWAGMVAALIGVFVIFTNKSVVITLDKSANKLLILKRRIIGGSELFEYELNQIKETELSQSYHVNMSRQRGGSGVSYSLWFILNDGQRISLNQGSQTIKRGMTFGQPKEQVIGGKIANFLGVPFQERRPPTIGESLGEIRDVVQEQIEKARQEKKDPEK